MEVVSAPCSTDCVGSDLARAAALGGIAVFLHGYRRTTEDIDPHSSDTRVTSASLDEPGAVWDDEAQELRLEGVPIHLVTDRQTGGPPQRVSESVGSRW